jgi:putative membrane protein
MKLSKKGIPYRAARKLGLAGFFLVFSGGTSVKRLNLIVSILIATAVVVLYALLLFWEYLVWKKFDYFIQEDSVKITKGVFRRQEREIPFRRIQNVDIKRNIVHRILGIAKIDLETAGGQDTEASLQFVDAEEVEDIRERIKHGERAKDQETEEEETEPIYDISDRNLVILSATDMDARMLFVFLAGFGFFSAGASSLISEVGLAGSVVFSLIILLTVIGIFVYSFARNFEKYYGFRLWQQGNKLKFERGLLNRQEGTIPLEKVQSIGFEENVLKRAVGYATLKIETAGYSGQKAVEQGAEAAIPLAKRPEALKYAERLGEFEFDQMKLVSRTARRRYFARYMIPVLVASAASYFIGSGYAVPGIVFASGTGLMAAAAHLKWIHIAYAEGMENVFARSGFWNRRTNIVPYYRVQNLIETQTIFQRRLGLSSLAIDIAGSGIVTQNPVVPDLEAKELQKLKHSIYSSFQDSLKV